MRLDLSTKQTGAKQTAMMMYQMLAHHHDVFLVNLDLGAVKDMPVRHNIIIILFLNPFQDDWHMSSFDVVEFDEVSSL